MVPPEVILDRWVRTQLRNEPGFAGYVGKLNIELVEPPSLRASLYFMQEAMNEALRLENTNVSGGVKHPPFHFDYLDVTDGTRNAHAFQHAGSSFIVVTLPMIELLWRLSQRLSRSPLVFRLLDLDPGTIELDALQGLLAQVQLTFLLSHEYTHHIRQHCVSDQESPLGIWTEFLHDEACGSLSAQSQELDADGYAAYIVLHHLLRGERRESALRVLRSAVVTQCIAGDELLLTCFLLAVWTFLCAFWREAADSASVYQLRHPPPPIRIKHLIRIAQVWSKWLCPGILVRPRTAPNAISCGGRDNRCGRQTGLGRSDLIPTKRRRRSIRPDIIRAVRGIA
jgi:hypothetical protein